MVRADNLPWTALVKALPPFLFLCLGVFVLPFLFPRSSGIQSVSTLTGFNNSLAFAWYLMFLGGPVYFLARTWPAAGMQWVPQLALRPLLIPTTAVIAIIAAHVLLFASLFFYKSGFVFAEALYFQDLVYRMRQGAIPFVDVHFFYGPALLYPAAWLNRVLSLEAAYAVYYVFVYVIGLYFLWMMLAWFMSDRHKAERWFLFLALGFFNPYTGLNYTLVRHLLPAVTLMSAFRCFQKPNLINIFLTAALFFWALTYSPEIGLVTGIALAGLGILFSIRGRGEGDSPRLMPVGMLAPCLSLVLLGAAFYWMDPSFRAFERYLQPVITFSSGGWNTPIDPSLPMLTMIMLTVLVGAAMFQRLVSQPWNAGSAWLLAYSGMVLLMQRAAFGKADVVHIAYSAFPLFTLAIGYLTTALREPFIRSGLAILVCIGIAGPLQYFHAMQYAPFLQKYFSHQVTEPSPAAPLDKQAIQRSIAKAVEHFGANRLYYMHKLEYYRLPIYTRFQLKPALYYPSLTSTFTDLDIQAVIIELERSGALVIARRADLAGGVLSSTEEADHHWLHFFTSAPLPGSSVFDLTLRFQSKLEQPLLAYLQASYEHQFEDGEIVVLVPRKL